MTQTSLWKHCLFGQGFLLRDPETSPHALCNLLISHLLNPVGLFIRHAPHSHTFWLHLEYYIVWPKTDNCFHRYIWARGREG